MLSRKPLKKPQTSSPKKFTHKELKQFIYEIKAKKALLADCFAHNLFPGFCR